MKEFSKEEKKVIERMIKEGKSYPYIASLLGRTRWSVRNEVRNNGKREGYSCFVSEKNREKGREKRECFYETMRTSEKWGEGSGKWAREAREKVHYIEEQLKIITQIIMEDYD
jgi:predicted transcriptional regulator